MVRINPIGDNLEAGTRVHWDSETQNLFYVDRPLSKIYKYKPSTEKITSAKVGKEVLAFAFPVEGHDDKFIAGLGRNLILIRWDGISDSVCTCNIVAELDRNVNLVNNRINGGKIDPYGRLWAGTMGPKDKRGEVIPGKGALYTLTNGKLKRHLQELGSFSGIAFNTTLKKMYYTDSSFRGIFQMDYDGNDGEISNKKILFHFDVNNIKGSPGGLTIDQDGNLWLAVLFSSIIIKVEPKTGTLLKKIQMPTSQITSVEWGNEKLNRLYVTSAKMPENGIIPAEPAGCTFILEHLRGAKGLPANRYKL